MDLQEIMFYSFLSKKAHSLVKGLHLPIFSVQITMEEQPLICLRIRRSFIEFTLEMPENNENIMNLNDLPVSVGVKRGERELDGTREVESTLSTQRMTLREWIRHFGSLNINLFVYFDVGEIEFDVQNFRDTLPKVRSLSVTCWIDEPDENDILEAQNFLRPFLPDVQHLLLYSVPLQENLSLQHIGMTNVKILLLEYQRNVRFVDLCTCNVESCLISQRADQMSLVDLNRFFKLWIKGSNPKLKELFIEWETEIILDWNVLLKGLKAIDKEFEGEEETKLDSLMKNIDAILFKSISNEVKDLHWRGFA
ncbi:hypothetical protein L5515_019558 [Caenorhabditis briggsae]|uniref:Sdz-33 F-box domain-containing protein n=1 Tax=Caenorhabditis briggsae TaxID=6238 RepID=A0AAE9FM14_CAEBR|nr:hypothetical protein L5515_019558 [Caenorhabditis briggsae]